MQLLMLDLMQALPLFVLAGLLFVALTLVRTGLSISFARHPLFAGLLWWLLHGDAEVALPAAIFFELLWLDAIYVGTYVPPQALLSYLVFLPLALTFNLYLPQEVVLLLVFCMPLALVGAKAEVNMRARFGGRNYEKLLQALALEAVPGERPFMQPRAPLPVQQVAGSIMRQAALAQSLVCLALYTGCTLLLFVLVWLLGVSAKVWPVGGLFDIPVANVSPFLETWGVYWAMAAVGGLLALRIRWALACFVAGALAMGVFLLF